MSIRTSEKSVSAKWLNYYLTNIGKLRIREDLDFLDGEHIEEGCVLVRDPISHTYTVVSELQYAILEGIDELSSVEEIVQYIYEKGDLEIPEDVVREVLQLCHERHYLEPWSYAEGLHPIKRRLLDELREQWTDVLAASGVELSAVENAEVADAFDSRDAGVISRAIRTVARRYRPTIDVVMQPRVLNALRQPPAYSRDGLNITIQLFDPKRVLRPFMPLLRWFYGAPGVVLTVLSVLVLILVPVDWAPNVDADPTGYILNSFVAALVTMVIHELFGHAGALTAFGGQPRSIGLGLLMLVLPMGTCNTTEAYRFPSKFKRTLVYLAGIMINLNFAASLVLLVYVVDSQELETALAPWIDVNVYVSMFNLIPFLKLDGYYALSESLNVLELEERGNTSVRMLLRKLLFNNPVAWDAIGETWTKRAAILLRGLGTSGLGVFFTFYLFINVTQRTFGLWGAIGALVLCPVFLVITLRSVVPRGPVRDLARVLLKPSRVVLVILFAYFVGYHPMDWSVRSRLFVEPGRSTVVTAPESGLVERAPPGEGANVAGGQVMATLRSLDIEQDKVSVTSALRVARAEYELMSSGATKLEREAAERAVSAAKAKYAAAKARDVVLTRQRGIVVDSQSAAAAKTQMLEAARTVTRAEQEQSDRLESNRKEEMLLALWKVRELEARLSLVERRAEALQVKAPFDATVVGEVAHVGAIVRAGDAIAKVVSHDSIVLTAPLPPGVPVGDVDLDGSATALLPQRDYRPLRIKPARVLGAHEAHARVEFHPFYSSKRSELPLRTDEPAQVLIPLQKSSVLGYFVKYVYISTRNSLETFFSG